MPQSESPAYTELKEHLREMFQLDRGDLDFGIYRIMNVKRKEIEEFLDDQLLPQVRSILKSYRPGGLEKFEYEMEDAEDDPEKYSQTHVERLKKILSYDIDVDKIEAEIYSGLYNFFKRYYCEGDFLSLRRYKDGVYALPYEGEEVKLHWANHDQYYIKTGEDLKHYTFMVPDGRRVRFEIKSGNTEKNNNKASNGKERRFILAGAKPLTLDGSQLIIQFEYRPDEAKRTQDTINEVTIKTLSGKKQVIGLGLTTLSPTEVKPGRTLLEKHLTIYTAKFTFDYFIHKDLDGFLRRELDFYIKNEIMHLDDVENEVAPNVENYLAKIRAMRQVAGKIIQFLSQIEDFQKRLWLKKKFVLETNYCVTLDRIIGSEAEGELLPQIMANDEQREEWVRLFDINKLDGYSSPLAEEFLRSLDKLPVDTRLYDSDFKYTLIGSFDDLDSSIDGVLINSENFQALSFLQERFRERIQSIYIDPPYNTGSDENFFYKDSYGKSSWLSMMVDRLLASRELLTGSGSIYTQIDSNETHRLRMLLDDLFVFQREIIWDFRVLSGYKTIAPNWIRGHDTIYFHSKTDNKLFNKLRQPHTEKYKETFKQVDDDGRKYMVRGGRRYWDEVEEKGKPFGDVWSDIMSFQQQPMASERVGFGTQKPEKLLERIILSSTQPGDFVMDYFLGSGTTSATSIKLGRKFIGCEMGENYDKLILPRMKEALYGFETSSSKTIGYKGGGVMKYLTLEQYEDTLENLRMERTPEQDGLLEAYTAMREEYMLRYMMDIESRGSASLLDTDAFADPFAYRLDIIRDDEIKRVAVDLVETFNYLLGLEVKKIARDSAGVVTVAGTNSQHEECLIIWRNTERMDRDKLDAWFKDRYVDAGLDVSVIYVNGDNNIGNLKPAGQYWEVRLIEAEFKRLMFDVQNF